MKIATKTLIEAITTLDPAANSLVTSLTLILEGGDHFQTDDVTADNVMLWARQINDHNKWLYIASDQIVGFVASIDAKACEAEKIDATVVGVIKWASGR